jgi:hypothetical protein
MLGFSWCGSLALVLNMYSYHVLLVIYVLDDLEVTVIAVLFCSLVPEIFLGDSKLNTTRATVTSFACDWHVQLFSCLVDGDRVLFPVIGSSFNDLSRSCFAGKIWC